MVDAFERGVKVVFLDAPTGAGKTLIAEMVRRKLAVKGVYACNTKSLQDQFLRDFDYARVLKGRANYPTQYFPSYDCSDCGGMKCGWCDERNTCPYQIAKQQAVIAPVAVLNTAYLLAETSVKQSAFTGSEFVVVDECDTLEGVLMGTVEFRLTSKRAKQLNVKIPVKGARAKTVKRWLEDELIVAGRRELGELKGANVEVIRERGRLTRMLSRARNIARGMVIEGEEGEEIGWGSWVRDYDDRHGDLILKPVIVDGIGQERVWSKAKRWLCMSASIISADEQAMSLGLEDGEWELVRVPMQFPVENRPIRYRPVANMVYKEMQTAVPDMVQGLCEVLDCHRGERILVHTVSFSLTRQLVGEIRRAQGGRPRSERDKLWSYADARGRDDALRSFVKEGDVLFAPSMDRGVDLPDEDCRVCVVVKMPYQSLGDRQVAERMRLPGGQLWYGVNSARSLVQMTGRGVRHGDDFCVSYILDRQFGTWYGKVGGRVLPDWWIEALTN